MRRAMTFIVLSFLLQLLAVLPAYADTAQSAAVEVGEKDMQHSLDEALREIDKAIEQEPGNAENHANKAMLLFSLGRKDEVEAELDKAIELDPDNGDTHLMKSQMLSMSERGKEAKEEYEKAVAAYDRALEKKPGDEKAVQGKAVALMSAGRLDEALAAIDSGIENSEKPVNLYALKSALLAMASRNEEALAAADMAISLDTGSSEAYMAKVGILERLERHDEALTILDKLLEEEPESELYVSMRAMVLKELGRGDEAEALHSSRPEMDQWHDYEKTSKLYDEANRLKDEKRYEEALAVIEQIIALDQTSFFGYPEKGGCLAEMRRYTDAIEAFDKAIELSVDQTNAYSGKREAIGKLEESGGEDRWSQYEKSLVFYNGLIEKKPDEMLLKAYKWDTLRLLGQGGEADRLLDVLLDKDPDTVIGFMKDADLYGEAFDAVEKVLSRDPKNGQIYFQKAGLLAELDRYEEALAAIDKSIELKPGYDTYSQKVEFLEELGRYDEALEAADKAIESSDYLASFAYEKKGMLLLKTGRYSEAVDVFGKAKNPYGDSTDRQVYLAYALQKCGGVENMDKAAALLTPIADAEENYSRLEALSLLGRKSEMLSIISDKLSSSPCYRESLQTEMAFEAWWDDPDFIAVVGKKE